MGQALIEFISSFVSISGNAFVDTILFIFIEIISFSVAFGIVGRIFDALGCYDADLMSSVHWMIRIVVFVFLSYFFVKLFQFVAWLTSLPWWVYLIILFFIILCIFAIYFIKYIIKKNKNINYIEEVKKKEEKKELANDINSTKINIDHFTADTKNSYPRCGSRIVNRLGPYGKFVGCSAYPKCTYTRRKM